MIRNLSLILSLLVACQLTLAEPLATPHTFTVGTPAIASQVNENFQAHAAAINTRSPKIIVKSNGVEIGQLIYVPGSGFPSATVTQVLVTNKDAFIFGSISVGMGPLTYVVSANLQKYYESDDCSGQAYLNVPMGIPMGMPMYYLSSRRHLMTTGDGSPFYSDPASPLSNVEMNSSGSIGSCTVASQIITTAYKLFPNDIAVTGINDPVTVGGAGEMGFPNITLEIQ